VQAVESAKTNIHIGVNMSFETHLKAVTSGVEGAVACSLMGFDGIAVHTYQAQADSSSSVDVLSAWIEYSSILSQLKDTAELLRTGNVVEVHVGTEKLFTLIRLVNSDYFVVLGMLPESNVGKGRYLLRLAAPQLKSEL
jgi:predicted regulator of Ras-like GTPase activity (Roadblock/LC7/MglB family)